MRTVTIDPDKAPQTRGVFEIAAWRVSDILKRHGDCDTFEPDRPGDIEPIMRWRHQNVIVNGYKRQVARLLAGSGMSQRFVNRFAFGTGGHAVNDPTTPIAPSPNDTGLERQVYIKSVTNIVFPTQESVQFQTVLTQSEANGFRLTESGLICADNTLLARRTFPGFIKTDEFVFSAFWTLIF